LRAIRRDATVESGDSGGGHDGHLSWIVVGLIAGFIGSKIVNKTGEGLIRDIILGIIGAFVGGWIFTAMGAAGVTGVNIYSIFVAVIWRGGRAARLPRYIRAKDHGLIAAPRSQLASLGVKSRRASWSQGVRTSEGRGRLAKFRRGVEHGNFGEAAGELNSLEGRPPSRRLGDSDCADRGRMSDRIVCRSLLAERIACFGGNR
jgi:uncharacterized membrane protein YeaQ/YmgE (transglycosylase-associated protein family)